MHAIFCMEVVDKLLKICEHGNHHELQEFLENNDVDVKTASTLENDTPLQVAAANGHNGSVQLLLCRGADVNQTNMYGWTPLMQAARHGHTATVLLLLKAGASALTANRMGANALVCAVRSGHLSTVRVLLDGGHDWMGAEEKGADVTAVMVAAQLGHDPILRLLLDSGFDPNRSSSTRGLSPLMLTANNGRKRTAQILIDRGADVCAASKGGKTALDVAIARGRRNVRCFLEQKMADTGCKALLLDRSSSEVEELMAAVQSGNVDEVRSVLSKDARMADVARAVDGATPLMLAAHCGHVSVVHLLRDNGARIDRQNTVNGCTALMEALFAGKEDAALHLIEAGADVNLCTDGRFTAFDIAAISDSISCELIQLLAKKTDCALVHPYASVMCNEHVVTKSTHLKKVWWEKIIGHVLPTKLQTIALLPSAGRHRTVPLHPATSMPHVFPTCSRLSFRDRLSVPGISTGPPFERIAEGPSSLTSVGHFCSSPCRTAARKSPLHPVPPLLPSLSLDSSNGGHFGSMSMSRSFGSGAALRKKSPSNLCLPVSIAKPVVGDLAAVLNACSLEQYKPVFDENEVDLEAFVLLSESDLCELGIGVPEHRSRLLETIDQLKNLSSPSR